MRDNDKTKEKSLDENLRFIECEACGGQGRLDHKICRECEGVGVVAWFRGFILYWGKKINSKEIYHDYVENIFDKFINGLLVVLAIAGFLAIIWYILNLDFVGVVAKSLAVPKKSTVENTLLLEIFWFSVLGDMFLLYRSEVRREQRSKVMRRVYGEARAENLFPPENFLEIKKIGKKLKIDIAQTFSPEAMKAVKKSFSLAVKFKNNEMAATHLVTALFSSSKTNIVFSRLGVDPQKLVEKISRALAELPVDSGPKRLTKQFKKYLLLAYQEAYDTKQDLVDVTELLVPLVREDLKIKDILDDLNINIDKVVNVVQWIRVRESVRRKLQYFSRQAKLRPKGAMNRAMTALATPYLDHFSNDLTNLARLGYLTPCLGREKELEEIFRIIEGGGGSVVLVGNPGVGKTTIVEGLAELMVEEDVPEILQDKRLVSLSVARIIGGVTASEAEERLLKIIDEIVRARNVILFIDNISEMAGISAGREESLDLAGVLAQALGRKMFLCITSALPVDYSKYVENKLLGNVLNKVEIREVDTNTAIQILEVKSGNIEYRNKIYFSYDAINEIVKLSGRYIHERYLPDKAIGILEEVAVYTRKSRGQDSIVTAEDVAQIMSEKTSIPMTKITESEGAKLLNLEEIIHKRMVDQEEAVRMVAASLRRARAELREIKRPIANFLFLGPTGVGKTELAKTVADVYFGNENNMTRLDMSEYQDKSSVYRLIGAPGEMGLLTEAVRKNPYTLLLLDEIEKAHPDILNIFLQVMDDGRLTDSLGRTIDFTNVILIATSNAGTAFIQDKVKERLPVEKIKQLLMEAELKTYFKPEFLNRFDGIIVFKPLEFEHVIKITELMLEKVASRLAEKGINFSASREAIIELAQAGFDPLFGARPLRRVIQERVDNTLADYLLQGKLDRRDKVILGMGGTLEIEKAKKL